MTCQECQPLAIDLARGLPPFDVGGAVQRAELLSHIATCKRCAQWLREQEALSASLRAVAAADASLSAPAAVEANVMAAWRARQSRQVAAAASATQRLHHAAGSRHTARPLSLGQPESVAQVLTSERWMRIRRPAWPAGRAVGFAAAATILIAALTMASLRWLNPALAPGSKANAGTSSAAGASKSAAASSPIAGRPGEGATASTGSAAASAAGPTAAGSATAGTGTADTGAPGGGTPAAGTNAAVIEVLPDKGKKTPKGPPAPPRTTSTHAANTAGFDTAHGIRAASDTTRGSTRGANRDATRRGNGARAVNASRDANEFSGPAFVLLPYVEPLRPTEMRHIMRVRMPRAQVAAGELRAGGVDDATVLADVLVGEDGTARAVRIVQ